MLHTNTIIGEVDTILEQQFKNSQHITIASGYFGNSQLKRYEKLFVEKIKSGGSVKLLYGLGMWEGISSNLNSTIDSINANMTNLSSNYDSGVYFATERRYHGKIYRFCSETTDGVLVGSSNFSHQGNFQNLEANILSRDSYLLRKADTFLDQLINYAVPFRNGVVPIKGKSKQLISTSIASSPDGFKPPNNILTQPVSFTLPIRTQPRSSFNLTFGKGRFDRTKNIYTTRPYYEVEITLPREYWRPPLTNFVFNSPKNKVEFEAFTNTGMYFKCNFNRKPKNKFDNRPLHETGADFQSTPREELGRFVKNKLILAGAMNFGDAVTDDVLNDYGANAIKVRVMDGNRLHLEF